MQTTLTAVEEDKIAELLSNLTPMAYSQLLKKVDRRKWETIGPYYGPPKRSRK